MKIFLYIFIIYNKNVKEYFEEEQKTGYVKFFNESKGFGFIAEDETGKEYFVHVTGLIDKVRIRENDNVSFISQEGIKGQNAINVNLV